MRCTDKSGSLSFWGLRKAASSPSSSGLSVLRLTEEESRISEKNWLHGRLNSSFKGFLENTPAQMGLLNTKHSKGKQANILMLGLDAAGKSTLLYKFKCNDVFVTIPTIGFNVDMIETGKDLTLTFWDVGGQPKMRQLWCCFLENTDGLLYVVDSSDKRRLEESKKEFELILKNEYIKSVPVVVLANKQDLPGALNAEEITRKFNMKKYCSDRNWYVQPCCAITGEGLSEALQRLTTFAKYYSRSKEMSTIFKEIETLQEFPSPNSGELQSTYFVGRTRPENTGFWRTHL